MYKALVTEVYDGDTITVDFDLGLQVKLIGQKIRLLGINAPEVRGKNKIEGIKVRDYLKSRILNKNIWISIPGDRKDGFGRWLGNLYLGEVDINKELLNSFMEVEKYKKKKSSVIARRTTP